MPTPTAVSLPESFSRLTFLANRTPRTTAMESAHAFAQLADYRDGAVFIGHYAGNSEWERHGAGDEVVYVVEGETTVFLLLKDGREVANSMNAGDLIVVPQGTWHRFETPDGVRILTVTPQPTDHSIDKPSMDD